MFLAHLAIYISHEFHKLLISYWDMSITNGLRRIRKKCECSTNIVSMHVPCSFCYLFISRISQVPNSYWDMSITNSLRQIFKKVNAQLILYPCMFPAHLAIYISHKFHKLPISYWDMSITNSLRRFRKKSECSIHIVSLHVPCSFGYLFIS